MTYKTSLVEQLEIIGQIYIQDIPIQSPCQKLQKGNKLSSLENLLKWLYRKKTGWSQMWQKLWFSCQVWKQENVNFSKV